MDEVSAPQLQHDRSIDARVLRLEAEVARLQREVAELKSGSFAASEVRPQTLPQTGPPPPPPLPNHEPVEPSSPIFKAIPEPQQPEPSQAAFFPRSQRNPFFTAARQPTAVSLEDRVGSLWFNRIGIVLLLLGTSWFLKLAIDRGWIGPTARVVAGLLAGAGIVLWSERFRRKGFWAFSYSLKALGSGVLYLSLWAGFRLYALLPGAVALALMIAVTAWNAFMAWSQDAELLAAYALAGGYATPILLSTGGNHEIFLFTYLLAIDTAAVVLVRLRHWPRLLPAAFLATLAYFIGWYAEFFTPDALWLTSAFVALFGAVFASVALGESTSAPVDAPPSRPGWHIASGQILMPLANAAFLGLAFYSILQDSGHHAWLPWMVLILAAAYLGVMRLPQTRTVSAIHLSLAVVFLTVAIPLKASGHWITAGWLIEGLALVWVATRLSRPTAHNEAYAARVLRSLGLAALALGFCGVTFHLFPPEPGAVLWTSDTATALLGVVIFAATAWLALSQHPETLPPDDPQAWRQILITAFAAIDLIAVLLALAEILISWGTTPHPLLTTGAFGRAILALCILAGTAAICLRRKQPELHDAFWPTQTALAIVTFNLIAVLTGVREIAAVWQTTSPPGALDPDAALKQGLAISAYLMLYGAALLAIGFWKRSTSLRWQGLALLLFTILKTFLYDMRNLSQGYRVASFLALGALLMAISYAYQKDWLNLRVSPNSPTPDSTDPNHTPAG